MKHLVIIGGGFAGFWSAMSAIRQGQALGRLDELKITLISKDEYHAMRPRFYEASLDGLRVPLKNYLTPLKIELIVGEASGIDAGNRRISLRNGRADIVYDALILASGSQLKTAGIPGIERAFNVDDFEGASRLDRHLRDLAASGFPTSASRNFVVVGAGTTGLEVITALPSRIKALSGGKTGFNFHLVERAPAPAPEYSPDARQYILGQLDAAGIQLLAGEEVERIGSGTVVLRSAKSIDAETVIWTTGVAASPLCANFKGERDAVGRLYVDSFLRIPAHPNVFAAGDVAKARVDDSNYAAMSCQHAMPQGKLAGHNAVNALFGEAPIAYSQPRYATCLDLGEESALLTAGWERTVKTLGAEAKALKTEIVTRWIYPAQSVEETLAMSAPEIAE